MWGVSWEGGAQANGTNLGRHVYEYHMMGAGSCHSDSPGPVPGVVLGALPGSSHWISATQGGRGIFALTFLMGKLSLRGHGELDGDHLARKSQSRGL